MRILIPSYEPGEILLDVIRSIASRCRPGILVVDDGSGEAYAPVFRRAAELGCTVLAHPRNLGKGAALKTGFRHLMAEGEREGVVCVDGDGQHDADDVCRVVEATRRSTDTVVLGFRHLAGKAPLRNRLGNGITRAVFWASAGYRLQDTQTGLRGFPAGMLPWLCTVEGSRFEYEMNVLLGLKGAGYRVEEIPIRTIYRDGNLHSHFRPVVDSVRVYLPFLKFGASSLIAAALDFGLLLLFNRLFGKLLPAVVLSRAISSTTNYLCNRYLVFGGAKRSGLATAPRYYALVLAILVLNYLLLKSLVLVGLPLAVAKVLAEGILFLLSYVVQKRFVFARKSARATKPEH